MKNIFFNGGGFTGFYEHIGAINYLRENNLTYEKYYGVSTGAFAIIMILLDYDINHFLSYLDSIFKEYISKNHIDVSELLIKCAKYAIDRSPDAYKIANNRLYIGITTPDGFIWKSEFTSNLDLANACLCSANIPFISSYEALLLNKTPTLDGGISIMEKHLPSDVICVATTLRFPFCMIYPDFHIGQQILIHNGYNNMKYSRRKPSLSSDIYGSPVLINAIFFLNSLLPKHKTINDMSILLE